MFSKDQVQLIKQIDRSIYENEVFLSFNDDVDSERFQAWLYDEGFKQFEEYVNKNFRD